MCMTVEKLLFPLLQVAPDGQFLVGQRRLEEETGRVAHHEHDEVAVNAQHVLMVCEVPVAQVYQRLLHTVAVHVDLRRGQHGIGGVEPTMPAEKMA